MRIARWSAGLSRWREDVLSDGGADDGDDGADDGDGGADGGAEVV